MDRVASETEKVAPHDVPVCILGESGTGKELVARAIHDLGPRAGRPFVAVNCAALSPMLVESELFGHERGAFTGADRARVGAFEEALDGTLFLDEIGELSTDAQAKLLRTLEHREFRCVGGNGTRVARCRVIAATHQSLPAGVDRGTFRNDLFHRLMVLAIEIPPLRRREVEIAPLAEHFLRHLSDGGRALAQGGYEKLMQHRFPGNVRELRNVLLQAAVFSSLRVLGADDIRYHANTLVGRQQDLRAYSPGLTLAEINAAAIKEAIAFHGSHAAAARGLGIARSTLLAHVRSHTH
jgi:DNA-binding NtrC family response regulator